MNALTTTESVAKLRNETKGVSNCIHFNNAGAALISDPVYNSVFEYQENERNLGGYETFHKYEDELEGFYKSAAKLINANPKEIAFIENATRAWDMAFYSLPLVAGDEILTSMAEYGSNYISYLQLKKQKGIEVKVIDNDEYNQTSISSLKNLITKKTKLISITHIPTNGGLVNPAIEIGKVAKSHGILYLLDACQSVGQLDVNVEEIGCDFLSATGRKYLRGPRATGFLYAKESRLTELIPAFLDLHAATWTSTNTYEIREDAKRFECWEQNFAGKYGLKASIEYALDLGLDWIESRITRLANYKREKLSKIKGVTVFDAGIQKCGIVSFASDKFSPDDMVNQASKESINISTSTAFGTRLDAEKRSLPNLVRSSLHYYNTIEEIDKFCDLIERNHAQ